MARIKNYFYSLIAGVIFVAIYSLFARYGIELTLYIYRTWTTAVIVTIVIGVILSALAAASVATTSGGETTTGPDHKEEIREVTKVVVEPTFDYGLAFACFVGIIVFSCIIPALIIHWLSNPVNFKRAIKIAVFLLSIGGSIIYFIKYKEKYPTFADKLLFFCGVFSGLVAMVDMIF